LSDPFGQLRQAAGPGELLLELLKGPRRCPPNDLSAPDRFARKDAGLPTDYRAIFDPTMVAQTGLAPKSHIPSNDCRPGDARLRGHYRIFPDVNVVRDMHQVVELHTCSDFSAPE